MASAEIHRVLPWASIRVAHVGLLSPDVHLLPEPSSTDRLDLEYLKKKNELAETLLRRGSSKKMSSILRWILMAIDVVRFLNISPDGHDADERIFQSLERIPRRQSSPQPHNEDNARNEFNEEMRRYKLSGPMQRQAEKILRELIRNLFDDLRWKNIREEDENRFRDFLEQSDPSKSIDASVAEVERSFREQYSPNNCWGASLKFASTFYRLFQNDFLRRQQEIRCHIDSKVTVFIMPVCWILLNVMFLCKATQKRMVNKRHLILFYSSFVERRALSCLFIDL